jgi:hypothetical protein
MAGIFMNSFPLMVAAATILGAGSGPMDQCYAIVFARWFNGSFLCLAQNISLAFGREMVFATGILTPMLTASGGV